MYFVCFVVNYPSFYQACLADESAAALFYPAAKGEQTLMKTSFPVRVMFRRFIADYGIIFVLLLLCVYYSIATMNEQVPTGKDAALQVAKTALKHGKDARYAVAIGGGQDQEAYANDVVSRLKAEGVQAVDLLKGGPPTVRQGLEQIGNAGQPLDVLILSKESANWQFLPKLQEQFPDFAKTELIQPTSYRYPDFLKISNLMAIADRIVVIAIIAIGMTMVIITNGIDLSVGSLIAMSAVLWTLFIRDYAGAEQAGAFGMILCAVAAILVCACSGLFSGFMVTQFAIPPFIVTLAMMMVASGLAFIFAQGQSIYQMPETITWLGRGASLFGIPNTVVLMALLYAGAHILMTRTIVGRYVYAVGGNKEAARLSGVPVNFVLFLVYALSASLSGLGGIVLASQLKSGAPTYGVMYEMYVIAAAVVGGTSLSGGEGKILGTLIGAFIIAVIQNGMNLTGVESYTQKVVLGLVILGAVLLDMLKKRGWNLNAITKYFKAAPEKQA